MGVGHDTTTDTLKVYVRLPVKIKEELQIKDLHPDIQTVQLPRQKSRRWCFIKFQNKETLETVVKYLKNLEIDGKKIVVKPFKQRKPKDVKSPLSIPKKQGTIQPIAELLKKSKRLSALL